VFPPGGSVSRSTTSDCLRERKKQVVADRQKTLDQPNLREQLRRVCSRRRQGSGDDQPPYLPCIGSRFRPGSNEKSGAVNLPRGETTPVRTVPQLRWNAVKSFALNPVLSQNARPVSPPCHPSPRRPVRTHHANTLPSCLPSGRQLARAACPPGLSLIGRTCLRPTPSLAAVCNGLQRPSAAGLDPLLLWSSRGFGPPHQLNAVALCPGRRAWGSPVASAGWPAAPGGKLVAGLAVSLLGLG